MKVLGFGTYDIGNHPRVGVLLDGLRGHGHTVQELNRPLGIGTSGRVAALQSPRAAITFFVRLLQRWLELAWGSRRYRGRNGPDVVVVGYLGHFDVLLARCLFPRKTIVLDHLIFAADTADDRRLGGGIKNRMLGMLDRAALSAASVIVLDTADHQSLVPPQYASRCVVIPVGAPPAWFDARQSPQQVSDPMTVVFFGLFTPLQGTPVIAQALRILDEEGVQCRVTLVGDGQDAEEVRAILASLSGVVKIDWRDWVDSAELPALVGGHDVCLGIFGTSAKAQRVVPNKVYQGMAAGCVMVTSDTPVQRRILGDAAQFVPVGDAAALAAELASLAGSPGARESARARAAVCADLSFHPATVIEPLERVLA